MNVSKNLIITKIPPTVKTIPTPPVTRDALEWGKGLVDPFAVGEVKVPDQFCYPTVTAQSKGIQILSADSSGFYLGAVAPYPWISYIEVNGSTPTTTMAKYSSCPVYAASTINNMASMFSNYRVVAVGVRLRNLLPALTATGRVILAPYISANGVPGPNFLSNASANLSGPVLFASITGVAASGANLLEMPYAKEYSIQDLISGTVIWSSRPVSTESYHFHSAISQSSANGTAYGQSVGASAPGGLKDNTATDNIDMCLPNNYTGCIVFAAGLPANSAALELEYVFHYEGTPSMGVSSGALMPATAQTSPIDMIGMSSMLRKIANSDPVNLIAETALGSMGKMAMNFLKKL